MAKDLIPKDAIDVMSTPSISERHLTVVVFETAIPVNPADLHKALCQLIYEDRHTFDPYDWGIWAEANIGDIVVFPKLGSVPDDWTK